MDPLKELDREDLGGGVMVRRVQSKWPGWASPRHDEPFWLVSLMWSGDVFRGLVPWDPGGVVEARIFAPRPEDGPDGEGWLVTDCPGEAGRKGNFDSYEAALNAVLASLRALDAARRLGHRYPGGPPGT